MRTTEPDRWQQLETAVANITEPTLAKFREQQLFELFGRQVTLSDKDRFCTVEGLNRQLDEFSNRVGLVYYIDEPSMSMCKAAFEKTREEHYPSAKV